uniref:DEP domain-containing protein n=1 Tax=Globisporangium ultimum (strain ATCC 200006 / CBS 805.95 / DAOM BR144) TaxID=431595 RepID=K3X296_GLOUD
MWDILYPEKEKYPNSNNNHLRVFETVIAGTRPEVDPTLHPGLRELLTNSWHQDHWRRPSTQTIVQTLERIQEETAASFAQELSEELQQDAVLFKVDEMVVGSVTGECCGYKMRAMESVASVSEAIRLGNMLMSAGFLHHVKHTKAFEHNDSSYFFDEHNIRLCQPFAILEVDRSTNSEDGTVASNDSSPALTSPGWLEQHFIVSKKDRLETRSLHHNIDMSNVDAPQFCEGGSSSGVSAQGGCGCRRLGQRLQHQKSTKRLFKKKHVAIPEDSVLTATLLGQDGMSIDTNSGG